MISFKQNVKWGNGSVKCRLIDWCLAPTLAVFQLYRGGGPGWLNELGSWITQQLVQNYLQYGVVCARLCKLQKGALDSQPQVIKFTSCFPMVGGSLQALRLFPPLKLNIAESGVKHNQSIIYSGVNYLIQINFHIYA